MLKVLGNPISGMLPAPMMGQIQMISKVAELSHEAVFIHLHVLPPKTYFLRWSITIFRCFFSFLKTLLLLAISPASL